jgi:hypothetical protein
MTREVGGMMIKAFAGVTIKISAGMTREVQE